MISTEPQFERRTDHAVAVLAVCLALGDRESARQHTARQGRHDQVALCKIRCTADDFLGFLVADIHEAEPDGLLELGEFGDARDTADDEGTGHLVERIEFLDFETHPHETLVELLGGHLPLRRRALQNLGQPGLWNAHVCSALSGCRT